MGEYLSGVIFMVQNQVLNPTITTVVHAYGARLSKRHISYEQLIVFGSHVKGTAKPWSDIDVCVVSKKFGKDRHSERISLMQVLNDATGDIEPHPYNPIDLQAKWDPLAAEIRKYGIIVS